MMWNLTPYNWQTIAIVLFGIYVHGSLVTATCIQEFQNQRGLFNFSSSKFHYSVNVCQWEIRRPPGWQITLNFTSISFGENKEQSREFIEICDSVNNKTLAIYRHSFPASISSKSNELVIILKFLYNSSDVEFNGLYDSFNSKEKILPSLKPSLETDTTTRNATTHNVFRTIVTKYSSAFYIALSLGFVIAFGMVIILFVFIRRRIKKKAEIKHRMKHWLKNNRACTSQYVADEEVANDNPMYEGSRSRVTSNVLYDVPEHDDGKIQSHNRNLCTRPNNSRVNLIIENEPALYQNVDVTYSEPKNDHDRVESEHYERIKSFIHTENEIKENSYAEPSVLLNELIVSVNASYVSSQRN